MEKNIFASKTVWFNLLSVISIMLVSLNDSTLITEHPLAIGAVAVVTSLVNLGLRLTTTKAIK
jgi:hypothetical protein